MGSLQPDEDQQDSAPTTKRRRIALSCSDCRKRKLKCDKEYPICSRCREGRHPERCTYDPNAVEEIISKPAPINGHVSSKEDAVFSISSTAPATRRPGNGSNKAPGSVDAHIEQLEARIAGLERIINLTSDVGTQSRKNVLRPKHSANKISGHEFLEFRGKGCGTHFLGATHPECYLSQMPSLRVFLKDMIIQHPRAKRTRDQVKQAKFKRPKIKAAVLNDESLILMLPKKDIVDHHVKLYVENFENLFRVLHLPSFHSEYEKLWTSPEETGPMFKVHVMLMVAATYCLPDSGEAKGVGVDTALLPAAQDTACYWIEECEIWLEAQSQKHATLAYFQAQCLLHIAKTMQSFKAKRSWTAAGALLSFALTKGFHRNAEIVNQQQGDDPKIRISCFAQEMRRRLWSTIVELEMQAAVERGMPASLPDLITDCGSPANCDDEYLHLGLEREAPSFPENIYTRTSYQAIASRSVQLRQQLLCVINGAVVPDEGEFRNLCDGLEDHLNNLPTWDSSQSSVSSALLRLQLLELIMYLHRTDQPGGCAQIHWSNALHVRAAKSMLDIHQSLIATKHFVLTIFRQDVVSAALGICYDFETTKSLPRNLLSVDINHLAYLATALSILGQKIDWMGVGMKAYYIIAACEGLVKKSRDHAGNQAVLAAEGVVVLMDKLLVRLKESQNVSVAKTLSTGVHPTPTEASNDHGTISSTLDDPLLLNPTTNLEDFNLDLQDWDLNAFLNF